MSTGTSFPCGNKSLFISLLLSVFIKKKYFQNTWEIGKMLKYKIGGGPPPPPAYCPRVSSAVGDPSKIHLVIKRGSCLYFQNMKEKKPHTHIHNL
jgi:hypothetical protein